jgi:NAD(P)-dependent dehydrogenase (short-subunit alcohol dehydrogenase family)
MRLKGKTCIVTGGSKGIGAAIAELFSHEGANVVVIDIVERIAVDNPDAGSITFIKGDVSKIEDCEHAVRDTVEGFGVPQILVNNAGISFPGKLDDENSSELWHKTLDTNLHGLFYMTKSVLPYMKDSREPCSVINMSSIGANVINPVIHPSYSASKGAIISMTKYLSAAYAKYNIRFNVICPAGVKTPLWGSIPEETRKLYESLHPLGLGTPEDIAALALFLATEESKWVTGSVFTIDGGNLCAGGLAEEAKRIF